MVCSLHHPQGYKPCWVRIERAPAFFEAWQDECLPEAVPVQTAMTVAQITKYVLQYLSASHPNEESHKWYLQKCVLQGAGLGFALRG